jgi:glycerophosphoryl diester phosphodiesterase
MAKILGHRGCRGPQNPPENSLAAFAAAIKQGADGVEFDLHRTKDGALVVFHDRTLEKRSNGHGALASKTLAELKTFRLRENGKKTLSDQAIPTLDEVAALAKKRAAKDFILNIEIKGHGFSRDVGKALARYLAEGWREENFLVSAFDIRNLYEIKKILPKVPLGVAFAGHAPSYTIAGRALAREIQTHAALAPTTVNIPLPSMTPEALALIEKINAKPVAWTVREKNPRALSAAAQSKLKKLLAMPDFAIITDYPAEMRELA